MVQPSGVLPTTLPAAGAQRRPCPYCGTWNESEYSFCKKCGRPLPSLAETAGPTVAFVPPPPAPSAPPPAPFVSTPPVAALSPTPTATEDSPVVERPLTEAERGLLKQRLKSGGASVARFFGAFLGIVPLVMVGTALMGTPYVPENYLVIVLGAGFLGIVLSGVSRSLRTPLVRATKSGTAHEVYGVPEIQSAPGNQSLVSLGGLTIRMKATEAAKLFPDRMNRVTFADGGPTTGTRRQFGSVLAFLLEANGTAAPRPEMCYLVAPSGAESTAPSAAPGALMRKKSGRR